MSRSRAVGGWCGQGVRKAPSRERRQHLSVRRAQRVRCRSASGRHPGVTWLRCGIGEDGTDGENEMHRDASARTFRRKTWRGLMGG